MEKIIHHLESVRATIVSGVALLMSVAVKFLEIDVPFDTAWITVIISGLPLLYVALSRLILQRWISSALLISIAMGACIAIDELFAAGEVAFIMAIGELLEDYTVSRARRGITSLISLMPEQGRVLCEGVEKMVELSEIAVNDVLRVLPGERIPVDAEIVSGATSVDQSVMTGESLPVDRTVGDEVFCGTMNLYGAVDIRATKVGQDSSIAKMIRLVQEAGERKAPMQRIVDKWASWLVPIALLISVLAYVFCNDLHRAVTVLVVFCPCALALATPVSIVAGIGQAAKFGVLIKSGEALEMMGKVSVFAFDKTGTLTRGELQVCDVKSFVQAFTNDELLRLTASAERLSEHPIGRAVVEYCAQQKIVLSEPSDFVIKPGRGISAVVDGRVIVCGTAIYLSEKDVEPSAEVVQALDRLRSEGKAAVLTAVDGVCVGLIALSDVVRSEARATLNALEAMGVDTMMLTGDNARAASFFASQTGIGSYRADLLPEHKTMVINDLQRSGKRVCMIGDGVNDAPALKLSDVGVAMGTMGSDIAIESADIALMGDDIAKLPYIKRLSLAVVRSIKLNITLSMAINVVAVALSVMGVLNPISGAIVHNVGSVLVVLNAALLYDRKV